MPCRDCGKELTEEDLQRCRNPLRAKVCLVCFRKHRAELSRRKHWKNREKHCKRMADAYAKSKSLVFAHYGQSCVCRGESEPLFLHMDHINDDGYKYHVNGDRSHQNVYQWLVSHSFPEGFQVLCANCNDGKKRNHGICPHKSRRSNEHP